MIDCVVDARCALGEGPLWEPASGRLYWIDITGRRLHAYQASTGSEQSWDLPSQPGALALRAGGGLVLGLADGLAAFDPGAGVAPHRVDPEPDLPDNRLNDGSTDRQGRFWFGTMDAKGNRRTGSVYRFDPDASLHRQLDGVAIPNSLAFSPGGDVMYFADSEDRTIYAFDYDATTGTPSDRRVFAITDSGLPDGSTVDADGFLWNAEWGGGRIVRYAPDGSIDRIVAMPIERPTCCAFGGAALDVLYVTSAAMEPGVPEPCSGGLFAFEPGVSGLAATPWAGGRKAASSSGEGTAP